MFCEYPEFYSESCHIARKEHKCCETGRIIKPGEKYWKCRMKFDGDFVEYKQSDEAYHFARRLNGIEPKIHEKSPSIGREECIPFTYISEWINEFNLDYPELYQEWQQLCSKN